MIRFHALATHLYDELGHRYVYHLCFRSAIQKLGLAYKGYTNKKCSIPNLPEDWEQNLLWKEGKNTPGKIWQFFKRLFCFYRIFRRNPERGERRIFFVESLSLIDLISLTLNLLFIAKKTDQFWLLLRVDFRKLPFKEKLYCFCFRLIQKKMKNHFVLLTDSERVGNYFEEKLKRSVYLVPIPHTDFHETPEKTSNRIILWWPGRPGLDKGAAEIQKLVQQKGEFPIELRLSIHAKAWIQNASFPLTFLNAILSRDEYVGQFHVCNAVLLPYNAEIYYSRTSGIFVEAVFAGKPPFVTEGSWLANELHKHNLSELILDWTRPNLMAHIIELLKDQAMCAKFKAMREAYITYHSLPTYTKQLERILKNSQIDCS